jgi:hypothetical protein
MTGRARGEAFALEHRGQRLASRAVFRRRLFWYLGSAVVLVAATLGAGMAGYHWLEGLSWLDSFLNAAMILGGMGPVAELHSAAGKVFAGAYALFCGLVFVLTVGILFTPLLHRLLHRFHLGEDREVSGP